MKKLMLALTIASMAIGAQAATVDWSSGVFESSTGVSSKTGSAYDNLYTAVFSVYSDAAGNNLLASDTTDSVNKKGLMKGTVSMDKPSAGTTATYYTKLVITEKATSKVLDSGMGSFTWNGDALDDPAVIFFGEDASGFAAGGTPANSAGAAANWGGSGGGGSIPEPTSGLLMLVGLGALALRRRKQA